MKLLTVGLVIISVCFILIVNCSEEQEENEYEDEDENEEEKEEINDSLYSEESDEVPRVRIKVFRGPMEEDNGEFFAPWGFWIKQPSIK